MYLRKRKMKRLTALAVAAVVSGLAWTGAYAAEHEIRMLNKGPEGQPMQFDPAFLKIEPGDSVTFIPTDKGHNSESILEMIPEGAETWKGKINEEITVTFNVEGVYGYKCMPHFGLGMVGIIQVGDSTENLDSAETAKLPGRAKTRMAELIAQVGGSAPEGAASSAEDGAATSAE
jgi:pseudoazurin